MFELRSGKAGDNVQAKGKDRGWGFLSTKVNHLILTATVLAIGGTVAFMIWHTSLESFLGTEVFRLNYQFLLIVVVGGIGTYLLSVYSKDREAQREKRDQERALQREFYRDLIQAYNTAKKVRRLLRVCNRRDEIKTEASPYDKPMEELVNSQLQFELLMEEAPTRFPSLNGCHDMKAELHKVEQYLGKIISEYEKGIREGEKGNPNFARLRRFIAKGGEPGFYEFKLHFSNPVHDVARDVMKLLTQEVDEKHKE